MSESQIVVADKKLWKTPEAIVSYPYFAKGQIERDDDGKPKANGKVQFSGAFIFTAATDISAGKAAALAAAQEKWGDKAIEMIQSGALKWPFRKDGATKGYDKVAGAGCIFFNARSIKKPGCVYRHAAPGSTKPAEVPFDKIEDVFYPGSHVRATVRAFWFENRSKGVSFSLNNVQFLGDGERLDSRVAAEDDFSADLAAAPADISSIM